VNSMPEKQEIIFNPNYFSAFPSTPPPVVIVTFCIVWEQRSNFTIRMFSFFFHLLGFRDTPLSRTATSGPSFHLARVPPTKTTTWCWCRHVSVVLNWTRNVVTLSFSDGVSNFAVTVLKPTILPLTPQPFCRLVSGCLFSFFFLEPFPQGEFFAFWQMERCFYPSPPWHGIFSQFPGHLVLDPP